MLTKSQIVKIIQSNNSKIRSYGVKEIGIFGSFVRSTQNSKSDIDILVEFQKDKKLFDNYMELKFFLEKLLHRKIDLVIKEALKQEIKPYINKEVEYAHL